MNRLSATPGRITVSVIAVAAAGLVLAGCGASPGSGSATSGSATSGGSSAGQTTTSASPGTGASGSAVATSAFFPVAVGNTWVYQQDLGPSLGEKGTSTNKVIAVTPVAGGQRVTMTVKDDIAGLAAESKTTTSTLSFHSDGSISLPLTQLGSTKVSVKSGAIIWPSAAGPASGQSRTATIVMNVADAGRSSTANLHVTVKGGGTATVTVPAGTCHTTFADEIMSEHVNGVSVNIEVQTWVANGVGPVKSVATTKYGSVTTPVSSEALESFTRG